MIKSMTGYGRAELANDDLKITVEIKSVNNRYLDIGIKGIQYPRGTQEVYQTRQGRRLYYIRRSQRSQYER